MCISKNMFGICAIDILKEKIYISEDTITMDNNSIYQHFKFDKLYVISQGKYTCDCESENIKNNFITNKQCQSYICEILKLKNIYQLNQDTCNEPMKYNNGMLSLGNLFFMIAKYN